MKTIETLSNKKISLLIATIVACGVLFFFLPIVLISIHQVVQRGETRYTRLEVERAVNILQNESSHMDASLQDWANWDDTYQFAQDVNQEYIDGNLADSSITNLGIDIFMTVNPSNDMVYLKYVNPETGVEAPAPFDADTLLGTYPILLQQGDIHQGHSGLAMIDGYQMLVASRPILTSMKEGPSGGTLIWIRLIDEGELENYSKLTLRKVGLLPVGSILETAPGLPAPSALGDNILVQPRDSQIVVGYQYLKDLNGDPIFLLSVENPRDLYMQGRITSLIFTGAFCLLGIILFGGSYHLTLNLLNTRKTSQEYLRRYQTIVHQSNEAILLIDLDGRILESNPASHQLLQWKAAPGSQHNLNTILKFDAELDENYLRELCRNGASVDLRCTRHDGTVMDVDLSASLIADGKTQNFSIILRDVTARKAAELALQASEERYMLAAAGSNDGLWDWNLTSGEVYYSPRWKAMLGCKDEDIPPCPESWLERLHPDDLLMFQTMLADHLHQRSENFECEYRIRHADGTYRWMLARGVAVWSPAGYAYRIAGSQTDITRRKKLEEQLRYDALHDGLTGLGNRTLLIDHLSHVNERKKRKPDLLFALFFLDFDRFKQINDSYGHHTGDLLLIEASKRLEDGVRASDTVTRFSGPETLARIAGDEYVLLLEDFQSSEDVHKVAERITKLLSTPYLIEGHEITLTASIGLVVPETAYENAEDIIRDADIAMYRAKQMGGAQIVQFDQEMYQGTIARMQLESDLRKGVERGEFEVYYQPVFTLDNDHIAGFEALVRWNHPEKGQLLPAEFIHVADEIGMIIPIGHFVLEEACRKMQSWRKDLKISPELMISVNLSARQILNPDLVHTIQEILQKTGFDPKKLWLEVTEDTMLENSEMVNFRLNQLRELGIRIEIDDFGTGYSSLSYLQNLPIDGFKIDRSFIKDIQGGRAADRKDPGRAGAQPGAG